MKYFDWKTLIYAMKTSDDQKQKHIQRKNSKEIAQNKQNKHKEILISEPFQNCTAFNPAALFQNCTAFNPAALLLFFARMCPSLSLTRVSPFLLASSLSFVDISWLLLLLRRFHLSGIGIQQIPKSALKVPLVVPLTVPLIVHLKVPLKLPAP